MVALAVGFVQEQRSEQSLEALNKLVPHYCHLIRFVHFNSRSKVDSHSLDSDGQKSTQLANVLVPGDLITFGTGDRIPADLRLTSALGLEIDESALTGETRPAKKHSDAITEGGRSVGGLPISERANIAFMGTLVRSGRGQGVVVGTGVQSEFGVVFAMMQEVRTVSLYSLDITDWIDADWRPEDAATTLDGRTGEEVIRHLVRSDWSHLFDRGLPEEELVGDVHHRWYVPRVY